MSRAAVSEATTQPRSRRPSTRGRIPCGSRAAYSAFWSMKVKQNAPRSRGRMSRAASQAEPSKQAMRAVTSEVSLVESMVALCGTLTPESRSRSIASSSSVLVRLPLCASASPPDAVAR